MFQADKRGGRINLANLVTDNDGSMPIDMTLNRKLEPMAGSKNGDYWRSDEGCFLWSFCSNQ
jgi:hypothetical protein